MTLLGSILTIAELTVHEARRRRVLFAALVCGLAFLVLFAVGFHFIVKDITEEVGLDSFRRRALVAFFTLAGLYAVNFLTIMTAVLLPVDTLSGEIASGVVQTIASKPVRRSAIVIGKWFGYVVIVTGYLVLLAGGIVTIAWVRSGVAPPDLQVGLPLIALEAVLLLTVSIAGGTRFSTVTNGILAFGLFGIAFLGGWVEQIGTFAGNDAARTIGTVASLIMPSESLWQLAAHHMQPAMMRNLGMTPFSPASVATPAMVWWAIGYIGVVLAVAVRHFARRAL